MTYSEKLKDPRWQRKRLEILQVKDFTCEDCGGKQKTLHVHHRYYISHREPWEYPAFCYRVMCWECHDDLKINTEERRESGNYMFEDWEVGLDWFGEEIFDMMAAEAISMDYAKAHENDPKP